MTRSTIDFGIDLGTTNSAVALMDRGDVSVIRNNTNDETTPSVVRLDPRGAISVGRTAYQQLELDPENTFSEFKRLMGSQQVRTAKRGGRVFSPEQLSAEVLKSLRQDVTSRFGEEVEQAVITVPALFELPQCEATQRAARLAGISVAPLLQEPVAAALAYGMVSEAKRAYWLVYDFGGGTFDTSIVETRDGQIRVVEHNGDNFLGGRDLDWALVDFLFVRLKHEFDLVGASRQDPRSRSLYARLKGLAEEARIQLSRVEKWSVEITNVGEDASGRSIETFIDLTRADYEAIARPYFNRSIKVAKSTLMAAQLEANALERIVLVGGPTHTPLIRAMLADELRVPLETRIDPMTIVARGAAVYAAMQARGAGGAPAAVTPGTIAARIVHDATSPDTTAFVALALAPSANLNGTPTIEVVRTDGGWTSGRMPVRSSHVEFSVTLRPKSVNEFSVRCQDASGSSLQVSPDRFSITQGLGTVIPVLSRALGVVVLDTAIPETEVVLPKGTALPASRRKDFRTRSTVRAGSDDRLNIHVVEGEHRRGDRNRLVGTIILRGTSLRRDLPANADIEVTLQIDASRVFRADMFIPMLDQTVTEVIEQKFSPLPVVEDLLRRLDGIRTRSRSLGVMDAEVISLVAETARDVEAAAGGDGDSGERAQRRLQDAEAALDKVEEADDLPRAIAEFESACEVFESVIERAEPAEQRQFRALRLEGEDAARHADSGLVREKEANVRELGFKVASRDPAFWSQLLDTIEPQAPASRDPLGFMQLISAGRSALRTGNLSVVRQVVFDIFRLLPGDGSGDPEQFLRDSGLRRR
ncbi:MAG: Hsp70 family protein [Acidimicrobiia bacterium]